MLIDTHCHLNLTEHFPDPSAEIEFARSMGVERLIVVGIDLPTSQIAIDLAERFEEVYAVAGIHPNHTADYTPALIPPLREMLAHPKVVALGEIGLDYHWDYATREQQYEALKAQLDLAEEQQTPIVFHCREAYEDLLDILESRLGPRVEYPAKGESEIRMPPLAAPEPESTNSTSPNPQPKSQNLKPKIPKLLLHCFAGTPQDAQRAIALDCYFGVDGPLTYKNAQGLRDLVQTLPRNRVVIETDAPYLTPVPHRGKPNRPAYVAHVNSMLATLWQVSQEEAAEITTANAKSFFNPLL